jgi:hypothetical protein
MSEQTPPMGDPGREPTEEEMRAAYEAELKRIRVEEVVANTIVSMLNLAARRAGLVPGTEDERDLGQVRIAIEATRSLLPLVEKDLGPQARGLRDALSQLQMAYAQQSGAPAPGQGDPAAGPAPGAEQPPAGDPGAADPGAAGRDAGPAERSGRLWIPGQ